MPDVGSINKVILLGYLGKDPELQTNLNTGGKFCVLSIATREYFKPKEGKEQEPLLTWHNCVIYGYKAENIVRFAQKGTLLAIEGKLRKKKWETKDGEKRVNTQVVVDNITIVGGKIKHLVDDPPEETPEQDDFDPEEERRNDPY